MKATMRSDKRKNPQQYEVELLTLEECKALSGQHSYILDDAGRIANVNVTSVKTWKTRPEIEVHCKYGLYEYFVITIGPDRPNSELIKVNWEG